MLDNINDTAKSCVCLAKPQHLTQINTRNVRYFVMYSDEAA